MMEHSVNRANLMERLKVPAIGAPLFIISNPDLVIGQCRSGIVGSFPALNARPKSLLDEWLAQITEALTPDDAPFAVNQIVHGSNDRLEHDLGLCVKYKVPVVITSLGAVKEVNDAVHSYGGIVLHDVIHDRHARKAIEKGADGLIAVAAGAGGHAGMTSPFALVQDIRKWHRGLLALSGSIASGSAILAAQVMGADLAYVGSAFIATEEANADSAYKEMITKSASKDIVYSNLFTGIHGNYLRQSIINAGLDPDNLDSSDASRASFTENEVKAWKHIWGCGQGIGVIDDILPVAALIARFSSEYEEAKAAVADMGAENRARQPGAVCA